MWRIESKELLYEIDRNNEETKNDGRLVCLLLGELGEHRKAKSRTDWDRFAAKSACITRRIQTHMREDLNINNVSRLKRMT